VRNLTVVGLQWGDEGKGKLVDYLAEGFDAVARFNGGSNTGHTVVIRGKKSTFHLIPSGALRRKRLLVGAGVAVDPLILAEEIEQLKVKGYRADLLVDGRCTLVSPLEREMDVLIERIRGSRALGTTGRGIGPAYAMRAFRLSPRAADLFSGYDDRSARRFYESIGIETRELREWLKESAKILGGKLGDVGVEVSRINESGGGVLFEGSQGALLDVVHGTYPYVTSSQVLAGFVPASIGVSSSAVGTVVGVAKCYTTRVGGGPMPTEMGPKVAERVREVGKEYGATTGRPRRIGWLDLVSLKYAVRVNGCDSIAVSKVDVLTAFRDIKVCVAYRMDGSETTDFQSCIANLGSVEPVYESPFSLYKADLTRPASPQVKRLVSYLEGYLKVRVSMVSWGEERSRTHAFAGGPVPATGRPN